MDIFCKNFFEFVLAFLMLPNGTYEYLLDMPCNMKFFKSIKVDSNYRNDFSGTKS